MLALFVNKIFNRKIIKELTLEISDIKFSLKAFSGDLGFICEVNCKKSYFLNEDFKCHKGGVCIDIGANIGCFSLEIAKINSDCKIFAFEPHPETFNRLSKNKFINGKINVIPINAAISNKTEKILLSVGDNCNMAKVILKDINSKNNTILVQGYKLDDFIYKYGIDQIELIKIDVEGHEIECLEGAKKALMITKNIVIEYHSDQLKLKTINILEANGFSIIIKNSLIFGIKRDG